MPIAAVVLTLDPRPELRSHALCALACDSRIDVGESQQDVWPAVLDTETGEEGETVVQLLLATPGVLRVDVVAIDFSCDDEASSP